MKLLKKMAANKACSYVLVLLMMVLLSDALVSLGELDYLGAVKHFFFVSLILVPYAYIEHYRFIDEQV